MTHQEIDQIIDARQRTKGAIESLLEQRGSIDARLSALGYTGDKTTMEPTKPKRGRPKGSKTRKPAAGWRPPAEPDISAELRKGLENSEMRQSIDGEGI